MTFIMQIPNEKFSEVIYRWENLSKRFEILLTKIDLSNEIRSLIESLTFDWEVLKKENIKLDQSIVQKNGPSVASLNEMSERFQANLIKLKEQLINLPYSKIKFINSFLKHINNFLEKLADFFMNGSFLGVPTSIHGKLESHQYNFFHPSKSVSNRLEDFLLALELKNNRYSWLRIS